MKILLPFKVQHELDIDSDVVFGGIESFSKRLYDAIPGVIPIQITKENRENHLTEAVLRKAILQHEPDIIITNEVDPTCSVGLQALAPNVPFISIIHEPRSRDIRFVDLGKNLTTIHKRGGHIYFVSEYQFDFHNVMCKRIHGHFLPPMTGLVVPSHSYPEWKVSNEQVYDCITVGRTDPLKDPFWLHRKLVGCSDTISAVITSDSDSMKDAQKAYRDKNAFWGHPRVVWKNMPHDRVLWTMARSKTYVSTCSVESWGITAMEALCHGLPLILLVPSMEEFHSSECIPADRFQYTKVLRSVKSGEFQDIVRNVGNISYERRVEISEMNKEKYSLENFRKGIEEMVSRRLDKSFNTVYTTTNTLENFL